MRTTLLKPLILALGLCVGGGALAQSAMPKLPKETQLPKGKDSPGQVLFKHKTHVKVQTADCTSCHPKLFKITEGGGTADGAPITHKVMKKGGQCGACHDGTKSFGLDECENCHTTE